MKLYSALYSMFNPFNHFYPDAVCETVKGNSEMEAPGLLIIHGGSDIHPSIYGRQNHSSYVGLAPSPRDQQEMKLMIQAQKKGIPIIGICRGAQLACALSGGILIQDADGHGGSHRVETHDGKVILSSSIHHQMMYPWGVEHKLLGWSAIPRATHYSGLSDEEMNAIPRKTYMAQTSEAREGPIEPEIVWFPQFRCLAVQGHPEMMDAKCEFNLYLKGLVDAHCFPT